MIQLRLTSDWSVILCEWLATDPRPGCYRLELPVWLGKSLPEIKISRVTCEWFTIVPNVIRCHLLIYDQHTKTCDQRRIKLRVGSLASEIVPRPFLTVKSGRGACRFQWRVSPSYCEYSGVTYDLLVSNTGGTYDHADKLPSNHEFGQFFVVSRSQVPRKFGVNLTLDTMYWYRRSRFVHEDAVWLIVVMRYIHVYLQDQTGR